MKLHLDSMKLPSVLKPLPIYQIAIATGTPKTCAIPLLNALPAQDKADYKIEAAKTPSTADSAMAKSEIGIPACK